LRFSNFVEIKIKINKNKQLEKKTLKKLQTISMRKTGVQEGHIDI